MDDNSATLVDIDQFQVSKKKFVSTRHTLDTYDDSACWLLTRARVPEEKEAALIIGIETTKHDSPRINSAGEGWPAVNAIRHSRLPSKSSLVDSLPDVLINNANDFPLDYTPWSICHVRCTNS